jgi:hypothetical protein
VLAVYVASISRVFMVPVDECPVHAGFLRLDAPRNNQRRGVRFAEDYAFEQWLESYISAGASRVSAEVVSPPPPASVTATAERC